MHQLYRWLCLLLLTGCATPQDLTIRLNQLVGQPATRLISVLGPPDERIEQQGQTIWVFRPVNTTIPLPAAPEFEPGNRNMGRSPNMSYQIKANCRVFFILQQGQAVDWYSQGRDCPGH